MGCVSSKHIKKEIQKENHLSNHVVSLTSSTYGALKLDKDQQLSPPVKPEKPVKPEVKISPPRRSHNGPPEIINAWELMEDLEDEGQVEDAKAKETAKKSPKMRRGFAEIDVKTPKKFLNQLGSSPKVNSKRFSGKENNGKKNGVKRLDNCSPMGNSVIVKASTLPPNLRISKNKGNGCESPVDSGLNTARRRNLGLLFDPDAKKRVLEKEEIKKMVSGTPTSQKKRNPSLEGFEKKCLPDTENVVVIYTTTLRGIRKTFEDCNKVRGIMESHHVRMIERDVSMDSGFKEELRKLLGKKEVKVPIVLVKGRLIGGFEEIMKLEEEGKLGILLDGIPKVSAAGCKGCGGVRFVMCTVCNGSCKLIGGDGRRSIKCVECNENGLVQCPVCCEITSLDVMNVKSTGFGVENVANSTG
ncbi:Glutaredoxin [Artemisia annua]|uniref:Glutaredoxin n=1 Tax=Artemisia annua TaxID=35608 RepID=A0A2U1LIT4_ARTAN|nr:Glutaredoxin [Artemisia annua]